MVDCANVLIQVYMITSRSNLTMDHQPLAFIPN